MRLLFVGNSYVFFNDLPGILRRLADAGGEPPLETAEVTEGGATLERHWREGAALARIREGGWDEVVLQEQSLRPVREPEALHHYARLLGAEIGAAGARPLFYLTWARRDAPEAQADLDRAYQSIAAELQVTGARVAPVGPAWRLARAARTELALHLEDGSHPTPLGSYLAACVFYAVLYGRDPTGLEMLDVDAGTGDPATSTAVRLESEEAHFLQRTAWAATAG